MRRPPKLTYSDAPNAALLDSNVFLSYLKNDNLADNAESVIQATLDGRLKAHVSSALYDDVITALRSKNIPIVDIKTAIRGIASIPHTPLPINPTIALTALELYETYGGSRRLHYFDSIHVATSIHHKIPILTGDSYIVDNHLSLNVDAVDLKQVKW